MPHPIVIAPGGGEVIGDAPDRRVEILSDHPSLHTTWSRFAAGRDGADLHVHRRHTDLFYVLEGELTLRLGLDGDGVAVPAGALARVPPDVVHGFRNAGDAEVRYLNLHAPGRDFASFMRAVRDGRTPPATYDQHEPPSDGGRPTSEAVIGEPQPLGAGGGPGGSITLHADCAAIRVAEVRLDRGSGPAAPDHPDVLQSFYVLDGDLALTAGDRTVRAAAGSWLQVAPGVAHRVACAGAAPVRYLDLRAPAL